MNQPTHRAGSHVALIIAFFCALALGPIAAANAQQLKLTPPPGDRGFLLGAQFLTNSLGSTEPGADPDQLHVDEVGRGLEIVFGYTFTPNVDLRLTLGSAWHGTSQPTVNLAHSTVAFALHYRFQPGADVRPYVLGGLGGTTLLQDSDEYDVEISGAVAVLGAGALFSLSRHLSLDVTSRMDLVNWNEIRVARQVAGGAALELEAPVEKNGHAGKLMLGLVWDF